MPEIGDIREEVGKIGLGEATIPQFGSAKAVSIRTALPEGDQAAADRAGQPLVAGIQKAFPPAHPGQAETVTGQEPERKGDWEGKMVAVSIDLVGVPIIKKKKNK